MSTRITVSITDEQATRLKNEQLKSGAPVSLVRRALDRSCEFSAVSRAAAISESD
jgi:hypothetical protein